MLQDYLHCGFIYVHCDDDGYVVATQIGTCRDLDDYGLRWNGASDEENY